MQLRRGVGAPATQDVSYGGAGGKGTGGGSKQVQQQQQYEEEDDRILCKWCGRKFNETAGNRHIPVCEQKFKQQQMKSGGKQPPPAKRTTSVGYRK